MITDHQALYYSHELTRRAGSGVEQVGTALFDAAVDLNPHQIEAALFHYRNPLVKGVLLADEVGLGKTIEAALILAQHWAERKRRLLIICPAALRKQWSLELRDKFNLPSFILDKKSLTAARKRGEDPLGSPAILILSYQFAMNLEREIQSRAWDLAVIDEAHKLRNCYRPKNAIGQSLLRSLAPVRKVLLSATPLQNSLMEVYGLARMIDEDLFGSAPAEFRRQFCRNDSSRDDLRSRLALWTKRTLRREVLEYVRYTNRLPLTIPFAPSSDENSLYESVTDFLGRQNSYALPERQRTLVSMVVRKLLSSSSSALAATLETMRNRLDALLLNPAAINDDLLTQLVADEDMDAEALAQAEDEAEESDLLDKADDDDFDADANPVSVSASAAVPVVPLKAVDQKALLEEIALIEQLIAKAKSIRLDEKTKALTDALKQGFARMAELGGARKVVVFTESRSTQDYLRNFLDAMPEYRGKVVLFNGTLKGREEKVIYDRWLEVNRPLGRVSGSVAADKRQAIIEHFRDNAEILITTESGSEGVNLQFCSLLINYDLPWNPQRVEQRIGRCHRYGQKHDVVVINFLNQSNAADRRVLQLLLEKLTLFEGVFGASDSVLGAIRSGVDIEREIARIYAVARTPGEINAAFDALERECAERITQARSKAESDLLNHFDEGVAERMRLSFDNSTSRLDRVSRMFWALTRHLLHNRAEFDDAGHVFTLLGERPLFDISEGPYHLINKVSRVRGEAEPVPPDRVYRLTHALGEWVLDQGKQLQPDTAAIAFDVSSYGARLSEIETLRGRSGWLCLEKLTFTSLGTEEFLLFSGFTDSGENLDTETFEKLLLCPARSESAAPSFSSAVQIRLAGDAEQLAQVTVTKALEQNDATFAEEEERLELRAKDAIRALEVRLRELSEERDRVSSQSRRAPNLAEKSTLQETVRKLEAEIQKSRRSIFAEEDAIRADRDRLIDELAKRKSHTSNRTPLFTLRWTVV